MCCVPFTASTRSSSLWRVITLAIVVFVGIEQGVVAAALLALAQRTRLARRPRTLSSGENPAPTTGSRPTSAGPPSRSRAYVVYLLYAPLWYGNATHVVDRIRQMIAAAPQPVHTLVLDGDAIPDIDYTGARGAGGARGQLEQEGDPRRHGRASAIWCTATSSVPGSSSRSAQPALYERGRRRAGAVRAATPARWARPHERSSCRYRLATAASGSALGAGGRRAAEPSTGLPGACGEGNAGWMPTALITGITGQDGSYLAELLLSKGYDVVGAHRRSSTVTFERIAHIADKITLGRGRPAGRVLAHTGPP